MATLRVSPLLPALLLVLLSQCKENLCASLFNISLSQNELFRLSGNRITQLPTYNLVESGAINQNLLNFVDLLLKDRRIDGVFRWNYEVAENTVVTTGVTVRNPSGRLLDIRMPENTTLEAGVTHANISVECMEQFSTPALLEIIISYQVAGTSGIPLPIVADQDCSSFVLPTTTPPPEENITTSTIPVTTSTDTTEQSTPAPSTDGISTTVMIAIIVSLAAVISIVGVVVVRLECYGRRQWRGRKKAPPPEKSMFDDVLIAVEDLTLKRLLGKGAFGLVREGELKLHDNEVRLEKVAVKIMKEPENDDQIVKFLEEALHMKNFHHPNVLSLRGVCFQANEAPMIVVPFMANGDLHTFLTNHNPKFNSQVDGALSFQQLLTFGVQVTMAMEYLSSVNFVHRDLAARNCLLSENLVVKVADFGLARDMQDDLYYRMNSELRLPVKWTAPESIRHQKFTTDSDIWAYGVLLWEIMSMGVLPYPGIDNQHLMAYLESGQRLLKPDGCPDSVFAVMMACWQENPRSRPKFTELKHMLRDTNEALYTNVLSLPIYHGYRLPQSREPSHSASNGSTMSSAPAASPRSINHPYARASLVGDHVDGSNNSASDSVAQASTSAEEDQRVPDPPTNPPTTEREKYVNILGSASSTAAPAPLPLAIASGRKRSEYSHYVINSLSEAPSTQSSIDDPSIPCSQIFSPTQPTAAAASADVSSGVCGEDAEHPVTARHNTIPEERYSQLPGSAFAKQTSKSSIQSHASAASRGASNGDKAAPSNTSSV